ncbi:MAG: shikimate kinase [Actinomycetota bacterium]
MSGPHLVVLGLIAAGKSTVADRVAAELGRPVLDSDRQVEALTGRTGGAIAEAEGVAALHELEASVLLGALSLPEPVVISAAASTVESARCRAALERRATVVWLDLVPEEAHRRATAQTHRRTISLAALRKLAERRRPLFVALADLRLDATEPIDALVGAVLAVAPPAPS